MTTEAMVKNWLTEFIVGHQVCPFAGRPLVDDRVRIRVTDTTDEQELVRSLLEELGELVATPRNILETTLLVFPKLFSDFDDFWAFWEWTQELLTASGTEGLVQLVGFHPDFYFTDSDPEDLANYTNRSPFPLLHLLREESVEEAAKSGSVEDIPLRNAKYLRTLNRRLLEKLSKPGHD